MIQLASRLTLSSPAGMGASPPASKGGDADTMDLHPLQPESLQGSHALIVSEHGLGLFGALIRHGCLAATCLRPSARSEVAAYDLAFFPDITPDTALEQVIRQARRAIVPSGRLVARISGDSTGRTTRGLVRRLKLHGFTGVRTRAVPCWTLVWAERPIMGAASLPANLSHGRIT
ncbi:hypothetical protein [Rhodopila sp.]|uniref:hypothetical protein n=1 Tax=Rhodopila sp. TaxID=2480087 RepID=UPI003D13A9A0